MNSGWTCEQCNLYNDVLTHFCRDCSSYSPIGIIEYTLTLGKRGLLNFGVNIPMPFENVTEEVRKMTPAEELFAKFFNQAYSSGITELSISEIEERIKELEETTLKAKASIRGYSKAKEEKVLKLSKEEREKLLSHSDITVSDALAGIKRRQDRISRADKLKEKLSELLNPEDVAAWMGNIKVDESKQAKANEGFTFTSSGSFPKHGPVHPDDVEVGKKKKPKTMDEMIAEAAAALVKKEREEAAKLKPFPVEEVKFEVKEEAKTELEVGLKEKATDFMSLFGAKK